MKRVPLLVIAITSAVVLLAGSSAFAVVGPIEGTILDGGLSSDWDPVTQDIQTLSCPLLVDDVYVPVEDGETDQPDAFDGGLELKVNTTFFDDADENGNLVGESLTVGPTAMHGLRVSTTARALPGSPTLQYLVKLRNPGSAKTRKITLGSDLGSDEDSIVIDTSSGDAVMTAADRWVLSSDAGVEDPPVTHVFFGKHGPEKVTAVVEAPGGTNEECIVVEYMVRVPRDSTRYMLFFAEMHNFTDIAAGYTASMADAAEFNDRDLNGNLLAGIGSKKQQKILNWDLT